MKADLTPLALWYTLRAPKMHLSHMRYSDVAPVSDTPIIGDRFYRWSAGETHEHLDNLRGAIIEARMGPFPAKSSDAERYLADLEGVPDTSELLERMFGPASALFGRPPTFDGGNAAYRWSQLQLSAARGDYELPPIKSLYDEQG